MKKIFVPKERFTTSTPGNAKENRFTQKAAQKAVKKFGKK